MEMHKVGDKVEIIAWYFDEIHLPQEATITAINSGDEVIPYRLKLTNKEDIQRLDDDDEWWFKEGEFVKIGEAAIYSKQDVINMLTEFSKQSDTVEEWASKNL